MDVRYKSSIQSNRLMERRYRQVLEEEQKSLARNKKLLEDIDRLEEQMKYFHNEYKQDEKRLKQAKDKFMQYVKSVYPKWTEDVKKWQAAKKRDFVSKYDQSRISFNPQSEFHSTGKRNQLNFTDSERSISHSGLLEEDSPKKHEGSLEYPRNRMKNPGDMMGSFMDEMEHSKDAIESSRDMMGYPRDRIGYSRDRVSYPGDAEVSSRNRMEYPREIAASRGRMSHSREMGLPRDTMGYSRNDLGFPRDTMYNGAPWMYPHHSPTGLFPATGPQYFLPVPAYGVPRWSTPGYMYDHWSQLHDRNYHDEFSTDEPRGITKDIKERAQDVSFEGEGDGQKGRMPREALPNARNSEYYPKQRNFRDMNSRKENFTGNHTADNSLDDEKYQVKPSANVRSEYHDPSQGQDSGRLHQETDLQLNKEREGGYEKNTESRRFINDDLYVKERRENREAALSFRAEHGSKLASRDRELVEDAERSQDLEKKKTQPHLKGELNDWNASEYNQVEHNPQSKRVDASNQIKSDRREYLGEPRKETRVMQLRSEGSGYGSREAVNTDSISLPTIHQYEGDIRDVFSDISSSEPLNQDGSSRADIKHSKSKDTHKFEPNVSQKDDVGTTRNSKKMSRSEATKSNPSVVEDLIGDDASDFQISEAELSEDDLAAREPLSSTLVAGSVVERPERSPGHEVGDRSSGAPNESVFNETTTGQSRFESQRISHHKEVGRSDIQNEDMISDKGTRSSAPNENISQHTKTEESSPSKEDANDLGEGLVTEKRISKDNDLEKNDDQSSSQERDDLSISKDLPKTDTLDNAQRPIPVEESKTKTDVRDSEDLNDMKIDLTKDGKDKNEHLEIGEEVERKDDQSIEEKNAEEGHTDDGALVSEDEKSKSGVLEEVSLSTEESSSEGLPAPEKHASKKSECKAKQSVSYSEDFEDEKSVPLTQSAAYQKMLSTVDVSDEGEDIEEDFLEGTMSEANTTAQSTQNMPQTSHDSGSPPQVKLPAKSSKSRPTLSLFSSGERDDFGNSVGKEGDGVLSGSWKSSEASLSPPLSPDTPKVPEADKVEKRQEEIEGRKNEGVSLEGETKDEKDKNQAKPKESDTKSRIQAGFWNHSESESEVDLQISHGGNDNNDDDDEFDFYS